MHDAATARSSALTDYLGATVIIMAAALDRWWRGSSGYEFGCRDPRLTKLGRFVCRQDFEHPDMTCGPHSHSPNL
jgi:hypothetical protein